MGAETKEEAARSVRSAASAPAPAAPAVECPFDEFTYDQLASGPLNVSIPDNAPTGIFVGWVQTAGDGLFIEDVKVDVNISHTYAGDLALGLYYDANNDGIGEVGPVMLMCTPGLVGCDATGCCGCDGDLSGSYRFSDAATGVLGEVECTPLLATGCFAVDPSYGPLSGLRGFADGGRFILYAWDWEAGDVGAVQDFTVWVKRGCNHPVLNVPGDHATVQAALEAACDGDTIRIAPGTYGDAVLDLDWKGVTLEAADPSQPPTLGRIHLHDIHGGGLFDLAADSVVVYAVGDITVSGVSAEILVGQVSGGRFTLQDSDLGSVDLSGFRATAHDNVAGTMYFLMQDQVLLTNCVSGPVVVDFYGGGGGVIAGNTIRATDEPQSRALRVLDHGDSLSLSANIVVGGEDGTSTGIQFRPEPDAPACIPTCNDVWRCLLPWDGIVDMTNVMGNISEDPLFCSLTTHDYSLASSSPCLPGNHPLGADCPQIGARGAGCAVPLGVDEQPATSRAVSAAPNPARGGVTFSLPAGSGAVRLRVWDSGGRAVRTLLVPPSEGPRQVTWDQRNEAGRAVAAGVYFYQAGNDRGGSARRLIVLR